MTLQRRVGGFVRAENSGFLVAAPFANPMPFTLSLASHAAVLISSSSGWLAPSPVESPRRTTSVSFDASAAFAWLIQHHGDGRYTLRAAADPEPRRYLAAAGDKVVLSRSPSDAFPARNALFTLSAVRDPATHALAGWAVASVAGAACAGVGTLALLDVAALAAASHLRRRPTDAAGAAAMCAIRWVAAPQDARAAVVAEAVASVAAVSSPVHTPGVAPRPPASLEALCISALAVSPPAAPPPRLLSSPLPSHHPPSPRRELSIRRTSERLQCAAPCCVISHGAAQPPVAAMSEAEAVARFGARVLPDHLADAVRSAWAAGVVPRPVSAPPAGSRRDAQPPMRVCSSCGRPTERMHAATNPAHWAFLERAAGRHAPAGVGSAVRGGVSNFLKILWVFSNFCTHPPFSVQAEAWRTIGVAAYVLFAAALTGRQIARACAPKADPPPPRGGGAQRPSSGVSSPPPLHPLPLAVSPRRSTAGVSASH